MSAENRHAVVIGITGGIACGKSEVGACLEQAGFHVCDADRVAHELMAKGTAVHEAVAAQFGEGILGLDGEIDRPALGRLVFADQAMRERLNNLVHPAVRAALEAWIADRRRAAEHAAVLIPLLFESGMDELDWDAVICVSSSRDAVLDRLEKRGLTRSEAEQRMASQMPLEEKERQADEVLRNTGSLEELKKAALEQAQAIVGLKGKYERRKRKS